MDKDIWAEPEPKPEPSFEDRLFEKALPAFQKVPGDGVKSACVECDGRKWIVRATHEAKFCKIVPKLLDYEAVSYR